MTAHPVQGPASPGAKPAGPAARRYLSLDAMRGFVMIWLVSDGFGWGPLAKDPRYGGFARQFRHVPWDGFVAWELVMPSFMFMMGVALPFALARRRERGIPFGKDLRHTLRRVLTLIALGQFLTTLHRGRYAYEPFETLTQLGLSYLCAYLVYQMPFRWQAVSAAALMLVNWGVYQLFPGSEGPYSPKDNIMVSIDRAVFGLDHAGSWAAFNFLGSGVTVLLGAWAGTLLAREGPPLLKIRTLAGAMGLSFAAALLLAPFNPILHKAWTATFTFLHIGCILACLSVFVWLFDHRGYVKPAFPLLVVGANSIFMYMLSQVLRPWISKSLGIFTGQFRFVGALAPVAQSLAVFLVMWCVCWWLYRRKIFFKV
jgi:heparan-alpha-glucosaminide N-acetyltransferase